MNIFKIKKPYKKVGRFLMIVLTVVIFFHIISKVFISLLCVLIDFSTFYKLPGK